MKKIEDFRKSYLAGKLELDDLNGDPIIQFSAWWHDAVASEIVEPNAMTLATVNADGQPSARIVLLKGISENGFEFYTNYQSQKARDIESNPNVALLFLWKELERQVRIEGVAEKVTREKSQAYFQSRPRGSQIGAWASPQSVIIPDREILENKVNEISLQYSHIDPLPLPEFWGGYIVHPHQIEFWHGRPDRMHDRFRYSRNKKGENWSIDRLAP
ncbi:MAG: pyridoxamine 5'-phosphate oxidase [Saprospiraceae bacterium]